MIFLFLIGELAKKTWKSRKEIKFENLFHRTKFANLWL